MVEKSSSLPPEKIRRIQLVGRIDDSSVGGAMRDIDSANENKDIQAIKLVLASGGGSIYDAIALHDHIKASEKRVDILAAGYCMSAAVTILQAGEKRLSYPNATFMIHPAKYSFGPDELEHVRINTDQYEKLDENFLN